MEATYELMQGGQPTGRVEIMTRDEARERNSELDEYGQGGREWQLRCVDGSDAVVYMRF